MAPLGWRIVAASSFRFFRFFRLLPMSFWSSCAIVFVGVILPLSALFSVPTPLPSLVGSLQLFVFICGVISLFFHAGFYSSLFFGVCPFHYWRLVLFLLRLLLFRAMVFILFALRLFSLSLAPPMGRRLCCGASAMPVLSVSSAVLHSPASLSTSLSSLVLGSLSTTCCACHPTPPTPPSHLLTASLGVRGAVPCVSFFLSPFFCSRLMSGWGGCSSFGSLIHGVSFRWQCSSLAWAVGSYGYGIDFLGSCCSPSIIGVVTLFLVLTPSPVRFGALYGSVSFLSPSLSFAVCF